MSDELKVSVRIWAQNRPLMMTWIDPVSGKTKAKTSGTYDWGEAERLAGELEKKLRAGETVIPSKITWQEFRKRYQDEKLAGMKASSQEAYRFALDHVDRVLAPDRLAKLTTQAITRLVGELRKPRQVGKKTIPGMKPSTLNRHLRHIKAALRWAHRQGYLAVVPNIDMAKLGGKMKGRPITGEEFDRLIDATPKVRENDPEPWKRLLHGLWLSGLRISEAVALDWNDGPFQLDLGGKHPCFRIQGDGQKSGKAELCPCTPDFVTWVLENTPEGERTGRVFPLPDQRTGEQIGSREAGPVVSSIGAKAGIVVDADTRKTASAHDLRRSFGSRWARKVMPAVLQRLMRHGHISTTMSFYVALDADSIGDDLWAEHGNGAGPHNNSRNICPKSEVADEAENDANPCR